MVAALAKSDEFVDQGIAVEIMGWYVVLIGTLPNIRSIELATAIALEIAAPEHVLCRLRSR